MRKKSKVKRNNVQWDVKRRWIDCFGGDRKDVVCVGTVRGAEILKQIWRNMIGTTGTLQVVDIIKQM
jgi:hypothetical protein